MITAYIGVGSNVERKKHIKEAIDELRHLGQALRLSTIYECPSVGFDGDRFYNLVVELQTTENLTEFSRSLRDIELKWGRCEHAEKFQPRTIDLDILLFGDEVSAQSPQIPRKDIYHYAFVLKPLAELCPDRVIPGDGRQVQELQQQLNLTTPLTAVPLWFDDTTQ